MDSDDILKILGLVILSLLILFIFSFFSAFIISITWNYIMPKIFVGIVKLGYWDAYVLSLLSSFLFKSSNTNYSKKD